MKTQIPWENLVFEASAARPLRGFRRARFLVYPPLLSKAMSSRAQAYLSNYLLCGRNGHSPLGTASEVDLRAFGEHLTLGCFLVAVREACRRLGTKGEKG